MVRRIKRLVSREEAKNENRLILQMRKEGYSYKDIAQELDCAIGTVSSVLREARAVKSRMPATPREIGQWWSKRGF